jgi:uncharacterized protein (TIGR00255 family)
MVHSMTGFGKASDSFKDKKISVEIKSLNSKQFDLSLKMPSLYREKELALRSKLADKLGRGKIELNIYTESAEGDRKVILNENLALVYLQQIRRLQEKSGLEIPEGMLSTLLGLPDVLLTERPELDEDEWEAVERITDEAVTSLIAFREFEGKALVKDVVARIALIEALARQMEEHLPERLQKVRERIEKNIAEVMAPEQVDKNRLEQEIVYYLEKLDITEEEIRLRSHCHYFMETVNESEDVGKKLGFIAQEIGREINTMGSKANYAPIQKIVVQMKDELEKIKEQLLNIR